MSQFEKIKTLLSTCSDEELELLIGDIEEMLQSGKTRDIILLKAAGHYLKIRRFHQEPKIKTLELDLSAEELAVLFDLHLVGQTLITISDVPCTEIMQHEIAKREREWLRARKEDRLPDYSYL